MGGVQSSMNNQAVDMEVNRANCVLDIPPIAGKYDDSLFKAFGDKLLFDPLDDLTNRDNAEWSDEEKEIFKKSFLIHPKQFGLIAESLPFKTASQCVRFYSASKKKVNYKKLLKKVRTE